MISLLSQTFYLGANAKVQAVRFALCLALGLASGIIALLYLRKARPAERALTDFFATIAIGALFAVCVEFFLDGKFELYGLTAYILGVIPIPLTARALRNKKSASHDNNRADGDDAEDNADSKPHTPEERHFSSHIKSRKNKNKRNSADSADGNEKTADVSK